MIEVSGVEKSFRTVKALQGIDFTAPDGEVTGLIGPNGAGKTTALRVIYTVLKPDRGGVRVDGFDTVSHRLEVQKRIGVLPDSRGLYPRLTAREHVRYYGRLHGMGGRKLDNRIDELISILGMGEFADRRAKGFSKGQTRKVALARALVHNPRNLLLDEPTNGLDIASSRAVHKLIGEIKAEGRCVLFCSHIMQEVVNICDKLIVIADGRAVAAGRIGELLAQTGKDNIEDMFLMLTGSKEGW